MSYKLPMGPYHPGLEEPYKLGDTRAAMIEGPSREAIELVEVR